LSVKEKELRVKVESEKWFWKLLGTKNEKKAGAAIGAPLDYTYYWDGEIAI
jgi:hypothetical protein